MLEETASACNWLAAGICRKHGSGAYRTLLTLWVEPEQLHKQLEKGEIRPDKKMNKATRRLWEDYKNPKKVLEYYKLWFAFCRMLPVKHLVGSFTGETKFFTLEEWEAMFVSDRLDS